MQRRPALGLLTSSGALAGAPQRELAQQIRGLPSLKITDVKVIRTQPGGDHLVIVKSRPSLQSYTKRLSRRVAGTVY